jgi:hypothetical protein
VVATVGTWSDSRAAGSFQKPAVVTAGVSSPAPSVPTIAPGDFGGCGRGRVRDPQTHACRGPADIR